MPKIPDLQNMSPDRWLSEMQKVREELLDAFVAIFDEKSDAQAAAEAFSELFDDYALPAEAEESTRLLVVRTEEDDLLFEHETGDAQLRLTADPDAGWRRVDGESEAYRVLAVRALQLIPWWTEGAFADRVGRPDDFQ